MAHGKNLTAAKSGGVFAGVAALWLLVDQLTKAYFEGSYALGQVSEAAYGLFRFRLVHNTGMAWGMFGDSTFLLGVTSLIVCAAIVAVFAGYRRLTGHAATMPETCALALVFAGGLGNAIDRFAQAYVVDFIDLTFMDFPVFNIADIGVTCGFVLLLAGYFLASRFDAASKPACEGDVEEPSSAGVPDASATLSDGAVRPGADGGASDAPDAKNRHSS